MCKMASNIILITLFSIFSRLGMSKRNWQIEITQDHLEEADEVFEVTLVSPEGTVLGSISKAQVTIRDSGKGESFIIYGF